MKSTKISVSGFFCLLIIGVMLCSSHVCLGSTNFPSRFAVESASLDILDDVALIGDGLSAIQSVAFINWGSIQTLPPIEGIDYYEPFPSNSWWATFLDELDSKDRGLKVTLELSETDWAVQRHDSILVKNPATGNEEPGLVQIWPSYTNSWKNFVQHVLTITPQITHLQIGSEPDNVWVYAPGYIEALQLAYDAVQEFNNQNSGRDVKVLAAGYNLADLIKIPESFIEDIIDAYPGEVAQSNIVALLPDIDPEILAHWSRKLHLVVGVLSQDNPVAPSFDIVTVHHDRKRTYDTINELVTWYRDRMSGGVHGAYDRPIWVDDMSSNYHVTSNENTSAEDLLLIQGLEDGDPTAIANYNAQQPVWLMKKVVGHFGAGIDRVSIAYGKDIPDYFLPVWRYMGLFETNLVVKPAYYTTQLMVENLDGFTSATRLQQADTSNYLYRFSFAAKPDVFVVWRETEGMMDLSEYTTGTTLRATHLVMETTPEGDAIWPPQEGVPAASVPVTPQPVFLVATDSPLATYVVTYNVNGATSGTAPASQTKTNDVALTLASNSGSLAKTGYTFVGWNTAINGSATDYTASASYTANAAVILYAKWTANTYAVTYNVNGATSGTAPASQTKTNDVALTLQTNSGSLAKTGYTFAGWNTVANGSGTTYAAGGSYTANAAVTLYANWTANTTAVYRFWSDSLMSHFFTVSEAERDNIIATMSDVWKYEGISYYVYAREANGASPVYRFWSDRLGCHYFTISDSEKATLETRYSKVFTYEGAAWYAFSSQVTGTLPVYRFLAPRTKKLFFTISEAEKNSIIANSSDAWSYKGIAWYAYATSPAKSTSSIIPQSKASTVTMSPSFITEVSQAGELPGAVTFSLSYGSDEVVSAMVYDPVEATFIPVLGPTLSPLELMIPPLPFGQRYWLSVMSHHSGEDQDSLDYGGWFGRVSELPEQEMATVPELPEQDMATVAVAGDMVIGLPVEHIVFPETDDTLTMRLYSDNSLIQTLPGIKGGSTYELSVPAWNRWYRVDIVREQDGAVLESQWVGHIPTH